MRRLEGVEIRVTERDIGAKDLRQMSFRDRGRARPVGEDKRTQKSPQGRSPSSEKQECLECSSLETSMVAGQSRNRKA